MISKLNRIGVEALYDNINFLKAQQRNLLINQWVPNVRGKYLLTLLNHEASKKKKFPPSIVTSLEHCSLDNEIIIIDDCGKRI
jgi:hypothetical protein